MKKFKSNIGITLIALVVTIVVLLILASVSINTLFGENGLISKAKEAAKKYSQAEKDDLEVLSNLEKWMDEEMLDIETPSNPNLTEGSTIEAGKKATGDNDTYLNIPVPKGFAVSGIDGEKTLVDGIVIYDLSSAGKIDWKDKDYMQKTYNQYVWIEVPNDSKGKGPDYKKAGVTDAAEPEKIKTAIKEYTEYKDNSYNDDNSEYIELRDKMLKSVYKNAGFYIGRYEAGVVVDRKAKEETINGLKVFSKRDLYPCNYITIKQAKALSEAQELNKNGYTNTLLFGMQWDLTLQYLKKIGKVTDAQINTDSKDWGNYQNVSFDIVRGSYAIEKAGLKNFNKVEGLHSKPELTGDGGELLTTGATDRNCKQNIYDLAGNVCEWTFEYSTNEKFHGVFRGGSFVYSSSKHKASYHHIGGNGSSYSDIGFRFSMFK